MQEEAVLKEPKPGLSVGWGWCSGGAFRFGEERNRCPSILMVTGSEVGILPHRKGACTRSDNAPPIARAGKAPCGPVLVGAGGRAPGVAPEGILIPVCAKKQVFFVLGCLGLQSPPLLDRAN